MTTLTHKRALVFFSAGVGDAVLLVPLVNQLKKDGFLVTGLFTSSFQCESIFENTTLFENIVVKTNKRSLILFSLLSIRVYQAVFLNHFAYSRLHILCGFLLGKSVFTNYVGSVLLQNRRSINLVEPLSNTHDALQNVFLWRNATTINDLDFNLSFTGTRTRHEFPFPYIVLQISSANAKAPYKNWEVDKWMELLNYLNTRLPAMHFVLLGDASELFLDDHIDALENPRFISFIGKTTLHEVVGIISKTQCYIGLDSGLMHIAAALQKPTFTIWGASNPAIYGYQIFQPEKHKVVSLKLSCAPCSAWIGANKSRVTDPMQCPDFKCLADLTVERVKIDLDAFIFKHIQP